MGADNGGMVVDISEDGIGFQAVGRVEKGDEIAVSFSPGSGYRISARARIAWVGSNGNSGGSTFTKLAADSRSIIREWVAKTSEAVVAHEAAAAVESEISTRAPDPDDVPLVIERADGSVAPLPEHFAEPETTLEAPAPELTAQRDFPPIEPLIGQPVAPRFAQPGVAIEAVPPARPIFQPLAPPAFPPVVPPVAPPVVSEPEPESEVAGHVASRITEPDMETVVLSDDLGQHASSVPQADTQPEPKPLPAVTKETRDEPASSSGAAASVPAPASGFPLSFPASATPRIPKRHTEPRHEAAAPPLAPSRAQARPVFPPRNTGELFSRSPWISGESFPEEERSHKTLIAIILLFLFAAAAIASLPYVRAHRQQIGLEIETMGKSVSGQTAPNPGQSPTAQTAQGARRNPQAPAQQSSQQSSQRSPSSEQNSEAAPQSAASSTGAPSTTGPVLSGGASSAVSRPAQIPPASAATSTPSGFGIAGAKNPSTAPPVAVPLATGSTQVAAATGQFEFQQAQKYLNGTGGVSADPGEAAEWLWRSLEKGNTDAAIPLADLYLQGKGVSHSCLQARILLTTASHKGNAEAIQQLNQLPENCEQ